MLSSPVGDLVHKVTSRWFADSKFYRHVFALAIPVMLQGFLTQFVSLLDNVMVGQLGALPIAAVSITNQILFILNLSVFGAISGAEIFGAQFFGKGDTVQQAHTFWMKVCFSLTLGIAAILLLAACHQTIIGFWLHDTAENSAATLGYATSYMSIMLAGIPFYCLSQSLVSTLKESRKTVICMESAIIALLVNLLGDYALIFGNFGLPELGTQGAAIATVAARICEFLFILLWTILHKKQLPVFQGVFRRMKVPADLAKTITLKSLPLMANEMLWSGSMAFFSSCYSTRGLMAVSALAIVDVVTQLFRTFYVSLGSVISIILGNTLGMGKRKRAIDEARWLLVLSILIGMVVTVVSGSMSPFFAGWYNVSEEVRSLAIGLIWITALYAPFSAYGNAAYFIIRSGGNTIITFCLDAGINWTLGCPITWLVAMCTNWNIFVLYAISQSYILYKILPSAWIMKKGAWAVDLTNK